MNTSTDTLLPSPALRTVTDLLATLDRMRDEGHPARERLAYALDHAPDVGHEFEFEDAYAHEVRESNRRLEKLELVVKAITELKGQWADSPLDARAREAGLALMGHLDQVVESQRRHEQLTEREMLSSIWGWAPDLRDLYPWLGGRPGTPAPTVRLKASNEYPSITKWPASPTTGSDSDTSLPERNLVDEVERLALAAHEENLAAIELEGHAAFRAPQADLGQLRSLVGEGHAAFGEVVRTVEVSAGDKAQVGYPDPGHSRALNPSPEDLDVGEPESGVSVLPPAPGDECPPQVLGTQASAGASPPKDEALICRDDGDEPDGPIIHPPFKVSGDDAFRIQAWTEALNEQFATYWKFDLNCGEDPLSAAIVAWQWSRYKPESSNAVVSDRGLNNVRLVVMPRPDGKLSVLLRVIHAGHIERASATLNPAEVEALHADPRAFVKTLKPG